MYIEIFLMNKVVKNLITLTVFLIILVFEKEVMIVSWHGMALNWLLSESLGWIYEWILQCGINNVLPA